MGRKRGRDAGRNGKGILLLSSGRAGKPHPFDGPERGTGGKLRV